MLAVLNSPDLVEVIGKFLYDTTKKIIRNLIAMLVANFAAWTLYDKFLGRSPFADLVSFYNDQLHISSRLC